MQFTRTRDFDLVRAVLTHPSQTRMSADDATEVASWRPNEDDRIYYIEVRDGSLGQSPGLLGIVSLIPENAVCYQVHVSLLPYGWGLRTRLALGGAIAWAFRETPARRLVASIPVDNRLAIALGEDCGMREYGRNPGSFLRDGELHDQVLIGISKCQV